ncbi:lysine histidine transporter-like 8 [Ananas comosus]|uniref:Lysine histidine transporter-like 8 n=1 Tax=Ananas comosus TaxID=4615 RepID=A0A6P5EL75_ANACO|nr:lysine histidine transporter-like 8 [Ananas comosus]
MLREATDDVHSTPRSPPPLPVSAPPSQIRSPSVAASWFARTPSTSVRDYLEEVGHLAGGGADNRDAWLPITESRDGNAYYSAFHILSSGIGFQALMLPVAFTILGWAWGVICLTLAFVWQLYTLWLLVHLHESVPSIRYCRYLHLVKTIFGPKLGKCMAQFPIMYLSAGTCTALIVIGGGSMKLFFEITCGPARVSRPLTSVEWYLVFVCLAVVLAQLPNLNSMAFVSLVGAATAVLYCTMIWVISVSKGRLPEVSYHPVRGKSDVDGMLNVLNALGIIAFAFRGHNLVLEIQATMPSTLKRPSHVPMWRGVGAAYLLIALCMYPVAIGGFWAYGNLIPSNGIVSAMHKFHSHDISRGVLGLTTLLIIVNCLSSYQIYAMPPFDNLEAAYMSVANKPCPRWLRSGFRAFFGSLTFFVAVALPFLSELAGLLGGIALPVTLAYPCFMWILTKKPRRYGGMWCTNWFLGSLGMGLSVLLIIGGIWRIVDKGLNLRFFKAAQ